MSTSQQSGGIGNETTNRSNNDEEIVLFKRKKAILRTTKATNNIAFFPTTTKQKTTKGGTNKNELTKLIPGYIAPLQLTSSSIELYKPKGGLEELRRRALTLQTTSSSQQQKQLSTAGLALQNGGGGKFSTVVTSFRNVQPKKRKGDISSTAGSGWFNMKPSPMTDELQKDLTVLRHRNYIDPKRFYKSSDKPSSYVQVGTVVEGTNEFFSSRLTKKQRRSNITEEVMADKQIHTYAMKKAKEMQQTQLAAAASRRKFTKKNHNNRNGSRR